MGPLHFIMYPCGERQFGTKAHQLYTIPKFFSRIKAFSVSGDWTRDTLFLFVHIDSRTIIVSEHACTRVESGTLKVEPINCTQSSSSFLELEHYQSVVIKRPILEKKKSGSCLIVHMHSRTCAGRVTAGTVPRSPPKFTLRARMLVLTKKVFFFFFPMCWKHGETNLGVKL